MVTPEALFIPLLLLLLLLLCRPELPLEMFQIRGDHRSGKILSPILPIRYLLTERELANAGRRGRRRHRASRETNEANIFFYMDI